MLREAEVLARVASRDARWVNGDQTFTLAFRPVLPDEPDWTALGLN